MAGLMKVVQMTLEPELVAAVDKAARRVGLTRSAFARRALEAALERVDRADRDRRDREGYRRKPVRRGEFDVWLKEQVWPD
jgi:metal-responsive CopG/Arc/MetJ family transcriptional regulator